MRAGGLTLAVLALALAGCADTGASDRPRPKPEQLDVRVLANGAGEMKAKVLTRSGKLLVTDHDGSQKLLSLDAAATRRFRSEGPDRMEVRPAAARAAEAEPVNGNGPAISSKRIADFEAHALPALPTFDKDVKPAAGDFRGATVTPVAGDKSGNLVEVAANLRQGVDDDVAFAYATCALAGWAVGQKAGFARHIRSVDSERNGTMTKSSVFTISKTRPLGLMVVDVKETLRECKSRGIPAA